MISLDLMIALPIAAFSILLLFNSYNTNSALSAAETWGASYQLKLYSLSQIIVSSPTLLRAYAPSEQLNITVLPLANGSMTACNELGACRIATFNGSSVLLVITNESAN